MRYTLLILPLALLMIFSSCNPNGKGLKEEGGQVSSSLDYPKAEVKTADMACQCFSPLAEHSVAMQDWAAEHYDEILSQGNDMEEAVTTLHDMEQAYFELLEEARACYEDSLTSFGDFYMRGAPAFPFLMQEQCKEVFYVLMLDGGMAKQALYGQESTGNVPSEGEPLPAE
tara:strand:- start:238 stop:750 length:513 start_codon:yes stop_codon:yes gene_type:complete